jgi:hypothetical protein
MDVLDTVGRPTALRQIRDKLVGALESGGYLLMSDPRQNRLFETEWWGRLLLRGGKNVRDFLASHPSLQLLEAKTTETHVFALFRKTAG